MGISYIHSQNLHDRYTCTHLKNKFFPFSGACSDWSNWDYMDAHRNISEAMKMAEDWLHVEQVC